MTGVLLRRGEDVDPDTRGGDGPGALWRRLRAKEAEDSQRSQELEEARRVVPWSLERCWPCPHPDFVFACMCVNFDFIT